MIGANICHDKVITRFLPEPATCPSVQKFVTLFVIPAIVAVPGFADVLKIFPVPNILPVIACTWIPLSVIESALFVPPTVMVTVIVDAATESDAALMFLLEA